jgi:peroxiredoxin
MAAVPSQMLPLGTRAPDFRLPSTEGTFVSLADVSAGRRATLVMFICNHCPYVKHVAGELARLGRDLDAQGVGVVAISANDPIAYPQDALPAMADQRRALGYSFPYLLDESQEVAKAFRAACTPDFYLFDQDLRLVYRGQLDDSRPRNDVPVTGRDVRAAVDAVLAGKPVPQEQRPSIGCNIKWKPGQAPEYFG